MPVPRRRHTKAKSLSRATGRALSLFNVDTIFKRTRLFWLYGFTPAVIFYGMRVEPKPSWIDLINIWD